MKHIITIGVLATFTSVAAPAAAHVPTPCERLEATYQESLEVLGVHIQLFGHARRSGASAETLSREGRDLLQAIAENTKALAVLFGCLEAE